MSRPADTWRTNSRLTGNETGFRDVPRPNGQPGAWLSWRDFRGVEPNFGRTSGGEAGGDRKRTLNDADREAEAAGLQVGVVRDFSKDTLDPLRGGERRLDGDPHDTLDLPGEELLVDGHGPRRSFAQRSRQKVEEHGTRYMYACGKCRCPECKAANAAYVRKNRMEKRG
jgi:hypothetical protein